MTNPPISSDSAIASFLQRAGWQDASAHAIAGDASTRSYQRLDQNDQSAILMIAPPGAETSACPPGADEATRTRLGYNACARLAGPNLHAFVEVANLLRGIDLSAPEIYAFDARAGLALIEDLGDRIYAREMSNGADEAALYLHALDALARLHDAKPTPPSNDAYHMMSYDRLALGAEVMLLPQWYYPLKTGRAASDDLCNEYREIFGSIIESLSTPQDIVLRDYHAENLLVLPERNGIAQVGIIDFQDALIGHAAYDIASILEDARRDVDQDFAASALEHYLAQRQTPVDRDAFHHDYGILAAQRNAKILGIFARLAKRDNKPHYLSFLPRVERLFAADLARPPLTPLRDFLRPHFPELT